jgi:hypothetical protein
MEMRTKLFITGLAFMAITTMVNAQNSEADKIPQNVNGSPSAFVDANNNGVCDNYENRTTTARGRRGNGFRKGCPMGQGRAQLGKGSGRGMGRGMGRGGNMNFVDVDKNGVCDYYEASSKK